MSVLINSASSCTKEDDNINAATAAIRSGNETSLMLRLDIDKSTILNRVSCLTDNSL